MKMTAPAVFLDKDGTLLEDVPYNVEPDRMRWAPGAETALRMLAEAGFRLVVVSNQSGVARGLFDEKALVGVRTRLAEMFQAIGTSLADFYYCPHYPEGKVPPHATPCDCRKPAPGLIARAASEHQLDLGRSWMIGDILDDVEAGRRAGCRTILLDNGHETLWQLTPERIPDRLARDLADAARIITSSGGCA
jgi:histidinol-phosphate phosphatase family protein